MKEIDDGPFRPISGTERKEPTQRRQAAKWFPLVDIPDDVKAPPASHYKHGQPSFIHEYRDAAGQRIGYVCRFDDTQSSKLFLPLTWCRNIETGTQDWRWKSWGVPRPLYGLDRLAARPGKPVVICEGEKATDAASQLLPGYVAVTSPNGSRSAIKADWSPLSGRTVVIWPDADEPGQRYAKDVAAALLAIQETELRISIVHPPAMSLEGWDAADALADGWTTNQTLDLVRSAQPPADVAPAHPAKAEPERDAKPEGGSRRGTRLRSSLLELAGDCEFWHDQDRRAFATVPVNGHHENMRLGSQDFSIWFSGRCFKQLDEPIGEQVLRDTLRVLEARAIHDGKRYQSFLRIGGEDGRIYLDLGRPDWQIVVVEPSGWSLMDCCPFKPVRTPHMLALPIPEGGELLEALLRPFVNVASDRDFRLIIGWLVSSFSAGGEYPILSINGEQGSAKSTLARMMRMLIDPNKATNRAAPRDEPDLAAFAHNSRVVSLDNLSGLPAWLSDALCRIATGGGFSARANYTDMDEVVVHLENPIILNGIPEIAGRPDLTDRSILITLPAISESERRSKSDLWAEFEVKRPLILGALLDAVSAALRNQNDIRPEKLPRMAQAAKFVMAAECGLGWEPGTHLADLKANRRNAVETSLESEPVAIGIMELSLPWSGTPTRLHEALSGKVPGIPKTVNGLGSALTRIKPVLAEVGITVQRQRGKDRQVTIRRAAE